MKPPDHQPDWHHLVCLSVLMPVATHRSPAAQTPTVLWLQRVMNHSHRKGHHQQTTSSHMCPRPAAQPPGWNRWAGKHRGGHTATDRLPSLTIHRGHDGEERQRPGQTGRSLANLSMSLISLWPYISKVFSGWMFHENSSFWLFLCFYCISPVKPKQCIIAMLNASESLNSLILYCSIVCCQ